MFMKQIHRSEVLLFNISRSKDINVNYLLSYIIDKYRGQYKNKVLIKDITNLEYKPQLKFDMTMKSLLVQVNYSVIGIVYEKDSLLTFTMKDAEKHASSDNILLSNEDCITLINVKSFNSEKMIINNIINPIIKVKITTEPISFVHGGKLKLKFLSELESLTPQD